MKKVLIISYSFPPKGGGGVLRQLKFTKYLPDFKWQPFVLTVNKRYNFEDPNLLVELPHPCRIFRTGSKLERSFNDSSFKRTKRKKLKGLLFFLRLVSKTIMVPDRFIIWIFVSLPLGLKIIRENDIDLIYSIDYPNTNHIVGMLLHMITKKPWVVDFKDLWTYDSAYKKIPPFSWLHAFLERKVWNTANQLICVNEAMKNRFINHNKKIKKPLVSIIPNGFDEEDFRLAGNLTNNPKRLNIAYLGTLYHDMLPVTFLEAIKQLLDEEKIMADDIKIIFAGQPECEEDLDSELLRGLERIGVFEYKGELCHKDSIEIAIKSDILLLTLFNIADAEFIIPSKTFEYIASGTFIIALTMPGNLLSKLIISTNSGSVLHFNDLDGIKNKILKFFVDFKNGRLQKNLRLHDNGIKRYTRKNLTLELTKVFNEALVN